MSDYVSQFSNESIECRHAENVLTFRLLGNRIDYASLDSLEQAINQAQNDENVRAVAIWIDADGADADAMGDVPERFAHRVPQGSHGHGPIVEQATLRTMHAFTKPLIAFMQNTVNGLAIDLAAFCDIRVANNSMTLSDTRILQGRTAGTGIAYALPKLIGQSQAMRILLLGEELTAAEAHRIHFVHQVIDDAEFENYVDEFSKKIAGMATRAWEIHKMQVLGQLHLDFESAMVHSLGVRQTHVINDRVEGIKAWRERRDPNFSGT